MKRIIHFSEAFASEIKNSLDANQKRQICENAKKVVSLTMNGSWAALAIHIIDDIEKTIK